MILNIVISIATVKILGLIGVSIGTLIAMTYQTVYGWLGMIQRILSSGRL